jgi:hypothetical protein
MSQDPSADDGTGIAVSADEIRARAHDIWERHHRPEGYEMQFWLMAERELTAERRSRSEQDRPEL